MLKACSSHLAAMIKKIIIIISLTTRSNTLRDGRKERRKIISGP